MKRVEGAVLTMPGAVVAAVEVEVVPTTTAAVEVEAMPTPTAEVVVVEAMPTPTAEVVVVEVEASSRQKFAVDLPLGFFGRPAQTAHGAPLVSGFCGEGQARGTGRERHLCLHRCRGL